jgi:hypothetical protein
MAYFANWLLNVARGTCQLLMHSIAILCHVAHTRRARGCGLFCTLLSS